VRDIKQFKHCCFVTVTPSGWSKNDAGLEWLQQVFDEETKASARRKWRLLIIDSHSNHISRSFLTYCYQHKILVAIFPPHSTHTLQPADIILFKPLSTVYSQQLTRQTQRSKGLLPVKKGSFFSLIWPAWLQSFTKDNTLKAFEATGLQPLDCDKVLKRFSEGAATPSTPPPPEAGITARKIIRKLDSVVGDRYSNEAKALRHKVHHLVIENELLNNDVQGLTESLSIKKKQDKKSKELPLVKPSLDY
jgi:hypothetical protein